MTHSPLRYLKYIPALYLYGFSQTDIVFDTNVKKWLIISGITKPNYTILGIFTPTESKSQIPKGTSSWTLLDVNCNQTRILKLSSVTTNNIFL